MDAGIIGEQGVRPLKADIRQFFQYFTGYFRSDRMPRTMPAGAVRAPVGGANFRFWHRIHPDQWAKICAEKANRTPKQGLRGALPAQAMRCCFRARRTVFAANNQKEKSFMEIWVGGVTL